MSKCCLLFLLLCSVELVSVVLGQNAAHDKSKRSLNQESVVWDPEASGDVGLFPVRERRASWGKWGKLAGVTAFGLAPAAWERWGGRKRRSLQEENVQWDPEMSEDDLEDSLARERRASWGKWGKLAGVTAFGLAPAAWERWGGRKRRSLQEENVQWDPEISEDDLEDSLARERRASWGKWGKLAGVTAFGLAPAAWERWGGRKRRSLQEENVQWDPQMSEDDLEDSDDSLVRERRSWYKFAKIAAPLVSTFGPGLWDQFRGKRSLQDEFMEESPGREKRANWYKYAKIGAPLAATFGPSLWDKFRGKRSLQDEFMEESPGRERRANWYKYAKVGAPLVATFGPALWDKFRGKRSLQDEFMEESPGRERRANWYKYAKIGAPLAATFGPSLWDKFRGRRSAEQDTSLQNSNLEDDVMISDKGFKCDDSFCAKNDGWFEYGLCSPQVCRCEGGIAKPQRCMQGLVFDPQAKECIDPRYLTVCG